MGNRSPISTLVIATVLLTACDFTIEHDTSANPDELPSPFLVLANATDTSAGASRSGFKWLDFIVVGVPSEAIDQVANAVPAAEWTEVVKPGLGKWWGVEIPTGAYRQMRAWTHRDGRVFSISVGVPSNSSAPQPIDFHISMFPPDQAEEYLEGLNGVQELVVAFPPEPGPNRLIQADPDPRERGSGPLNSDR
jgi:hypothetical protein